MEALGAPTREPCAAPESLRGFCRRILENGDLETKLAPPPAALCDREPGPALRIPRPARSPELALQRGAPPLPRPGRLADPAARAACLARFAHHELMAVELFAWALLRYPALPQALRRGWLEVLCDEQRHCRLYLERLDALGSRLADHALSDYFWLHEPALAASRHGPRAFLCAMGLTLEQANLDFTGLYRGGFHAAGDVESAAVLARVHRDEIAHVRLARRWLCRLAGEGRRDLDAYEEAVPFPLGAARAKGRAFDAEARRRAGLSEALIDHVRTARSTAERAPRRPAPAAAPGTRS